MEVIFRLLYLMQYAVRIYTLLLFVYALLSWFPGGYQSSIGKFLRKICEPYLSLFDRLNLNFGGMSFTIIVAVLVLNLASQALVMIITRLLLL